MTSLFFLLLVSSSAAWYLLGLYDGLVAGLTRKLTEKYMSFFVKGWMQGFEVAEKRYKRRKHPVTGQFLRGDGA